MIARWCISAFIFLLTLFGVVFQQQVSVPNQEIVLQFTDVELTSDDAKHAIAIVAKKLQGLGAEHIQVKAGDNNTLKISYFSEVDISSIKRTFAKENHIVLDYTSSSQDRGASKLPSEDNTISYNLDVYEIQNTSNSGGDLNGAFGLEIDAKSDRFLDPNINLFFKNIDVNAIAAKTKVAFKVCRDISIELDNTLHSIPEVRAGPNC
ncbi:hypothetical protein VOI54_08110 [Tamlana sp. 2201CG12-4]|uniref:hypothetical protein n=1 Tax=Tamlana sp. 2201CG12-4 TaxID=3112582 RepID=UPI002DB584A3|nr:hypothetical protein [Tamlana sp. 2201CG12-4]MEC3906981.1 hypothetical protein [Tamlana sp. 2201CG12-4]